MSGGRSEDPSNPPCEAKAGKWGRIDYLLLALTFAGNVVTLFDYPNLLASWNMCQARGVSVY